MNIGYRGYAWRGGQFLYECIDFMVEKLGAVLVLPFAAVGFVATKLGWNYAERDYY